MPNQPLGNPYVVGQTLMEDYGFYGRQNLINVVINSLTRTPQNAIVLHGQRRIGKSSLLHRLRRDKTLQQSHVPIFFDLQQRAGFPLARILAELTEEITDKLKLSLLLPDETSLAADYNQFRRKVLPEIQRHLEDKKLLILFDEFDVAVPADIADYFPADTLLGFLQMLIEEPQQPLAFIFVVGQRLDLLAEGYRRLFRSARAEPVGRLDQEDTYELLTDLGQLGKISYTDEALEKIWDLTNGHPLLTQLIGSEVFDRLQRQQTQASTPDDVEACLDKAMEHGLGALDWFWMGFNREEQIVLAAIAELTGRQPQINETEIDKLLQRNTLFLTEVDRRQACKQLLEGDFLTDTGGRNYKFAVEFIRRWIVQNHSLKEVKSHIDQGTPEARTHYQEGLRHYERGTLDEAIREFRQAMKLDPHFSSAQRSLARVLRAQGDIETALAEYEKVYQLDPASTREELIDLRLDCIARLKAGANDEAILAHTQRILQIDPYRAEARQQLSSIYLRQARDHLAAFRPGDASEILQNLIDPLPIIQDHGVGQQVRDLWLDYSQKLIQRKPPQWDEAQRALDNLIPLGLLDETASMTYNKIILAKARASLEKDRLEEALTYLDTDLKPPKPAGDIKELLYDYTNRQIEHQGWPQAEEALKGLCVLINDEENQTALLNLYHQWGDVLLETEEFDEAIVVYGKSEEIEGQTTLVFKDKIAETYLRQADRHLDRHELAEAEASYRQAFANLKTESTQEKARGRLETYYNDRRGEQDWERANNILDIFERLGLSGSNVQPWRTDLYLDQARAALAQKRPEAAFKQLSNLGDEAHARIKILIKNYLRHETRSGEWEAGAETLQHLENLLANDPEATILRANWLFNWAKAISSKDNLDKDLAQAKALCQEILIFAPEGTPLIDLSATAEATTDKKNQDLRREVCNWSANILIEEAQTYLDQLNLDKAQTLFEEALHLPRPPDHLAVVIQEKLKTFSRNQIFKKNWAEAQHALEIILELGIGGPEINQLLIDSAISQADLFFRADQPERAFSILYPLKAEMEDTYRQKSKKMAYQFSRLYAGRARWQEAKLALKGLSEWLASSDAEALAHALDVLNHERLYFVRGKRLTTSAFKVPPETINYLREEIRIIEDSYKDAEMISSLKPKALNAWIQHFIEVNLQLGQAYVSNSDPSAAIQMYQKILDRESPLLQSQRQVNNTEPGYFVEVSLALGQAHLSNHDLDSAIKIYQEILELKEQLVQLQEYVNNRISQSLYDYSERILDQETDIGKWDMAQSALEQLNDLNLPAPYGSFSSDPRIDGATQRVILYKAQTLLKEDKAAEAFAQLGTLPQAYPWPDAEIKEIIWDYSHRQRRQENWADAIDALRRLDRLLTDSCDQVRDQDNLEKLVDSLVQWSQHLEETPDNLDRAADIYYEALEHTRDIARLKSLDVAVYFIRATLQLAQGLLDRDALLPEKPPVIDQALQKYQKILGLPERQYTHEQQVNEGLHTHARKLAQAGRWKRAHQILDELHNLYQNDSNNNRRALFATWRRDLVLDEVRNLLTNQQLDVAFAQLTWFRDWLDKEKAPETIWSDSTEEVKSLIDHFISQTWLPGENYQLVLQTLDNLISLLPNDVEIKGWQVETLCLWGQSLHQQKRLPEARRRYEQAIKKAQDQETIPPSEIEELLVETLLAQAEQYLDPRQPNLPAAVDLYKEALQRRNDHLDPSDQIRQALKTYSNTLIQQTPPDWEATHQALEQLAELNLRNSQMSEWQRKLTLREMEAKLEQDNPALAFASLEALERPWPFRDIQEIVHRYCQNRVEVNQWPLAIKTLKSLGDILAEDTSIRQWIISELMALGEQLNERGNTRAAGEAFEVAVAFS